MTKTQPARNGIIPWLRLGFSVLFTGLMAFIFLMGSLLC